MEERPHLVDRIDTKGNITAHYTITDNRTLCGRGIDLRQAPQGNGLCRRCSYLYELWLKAGGDR